MDEDLLYKKYKDPCLSEININCNDTKQANIYCQDTENELIEEGTESFARILNNGQKETIAQALQNCDYNTIILSNIISEKSKASKSVVSNVCNSFPSDCVVKVPLLIKNGKFLPTEKKPVFITEKCDRDIHDTKENKFSGEILNQTCDYSDSGLSIRQSCLKRKFESNDRNESNLRIGYKKNDRSKSNLLDNSDNFLSYSKHFKPDDSVVKSDNARENFTLPFSLVNSIDAVENYYNCRRMKNIEIQSSPIRIRVATTFGEDSIEYVDPTMEVELESDPEDPEETNGQNGGGDTQPQHSEVLNGSSSVTAENTAQDTESNVLGDATTTAIMNDDETVSNLEGDIKKDSTNEGCSSEYTQETSIHNPTVQNADEKHDDSKESDDTQNVLTEDSKNAVKTLKSSEDSPKEESTIAPCKEEPSELLVEKGTEGIIEERSEEIATETNENLAVESTEKLDIKEESVEGPDEEDHNIETQAETSDDHKLEQTTHDGDILENVETSDNQKEIEEGIREKESDAVECIPLVEDEELMKGNGDSSEKLIEDDDATEEKDENVESIKLPEDDKEKEAYQNAEETKSAEESEEIEKVEKVDDVENCKSPDKESEKEQIEEPRDIEDIKSTTDENIVTERETAEDAECIESAEAEEQETLQDTENIKSPEEDESENKSSSDIEGVEEAEVPKGEESTDSIKDKIFEQKEASGDSAKSVHDGVIEEKEEYEDGEIVDEEKDIPENSESIKSTEYKQNEESGDIESIKSNEGLDIAEQKEESEDPENIKSSGDAIEVKESPEILKSVMSSDDAIEQIECPETVESTKSTEENEDEEQGEAQESEENTKSPEEVDNDKDKELTENVELIESPEKEASQKEDGEEEVSIKSTTDEDFAEQKKISEETDEKDTSKDVDNIQLIESGDVVTEDTHEEEDKMKSPEEKNVTGEEESAEEEESTKIAEDEGVIERKEASELEREIKENVDVLTKTEIKDVEKSDVESKMTSDAEQEPEIQEQAEKELSELEEQGIDTEETKDQGIIQNATEDEIKSEGGDKTPSEQEVLPVSEQSKIIPEKDEEICDKGEDTNLSEREETNLDEVEDIADNESPINNVESKVEEQPEMEVETNNVDMLHESETVERGTIEIEPEGEKVGIEASETKLEDKEEPTEIEENETNQKEKDSLDYKEITEDEAVAEEQQIIETGEILEEQICEGSQKSSRHSSVDKDSLEENNKEVVDSIQKTSEDTDPLIEGEEKNEKADVQDNFETFSEKHSDIHEGIIENEDMKSDLPPEDQELSTETKEIDRESEQSADILETSDGDDKAAESTINENKDENISEVNSCEKNEITESLPETITQDSLAKKVVDDDSTTLCKEEEVTKSTVPTSEKVPRQLMDDIPQTSTEQDIVGSPEKPKSEQSVTDSSKIISPRKGIKVEEDEIETAISSVMFYDEMSDGNDQIAKLASVAESPKPDDDNEAVPAETTEGSKVAPEEKTDEKLTEKFKQEPLPLQATAEGEKTGSEGAKTPLNVSPKKRKKKRKTTRSRSSQKDGASSATKRTQEAKGSGKEGSRTSRSVSSTSARSPSAGEKKIPPIKAPVGTTPPPKIKQAKSKIGSLENVTHKPKGGDKKVESKKLEWNAKSKVGSLDYANYKPGGGDKKIITQKIDFKNVQSKVGSKENLKHKPGGGNLKIATEKLDFKAKAASKVGSLDNAKHKPGGGNVTIKSEKLHFKDKAAPKIHSRSGSERGSSHGGSETQSPVMPSSPAPPEGMPPLCEDDSPSSQEEPKPEKVECNGNGENAQGPPSTDASPTKSPDKAEDATEDQLIAF